MAVVTEPTQLINMQEVSQQLEVLQQTNLFEQADEPHYHVLLEYRIEGIGNSVIIYVQKGLEDRACQCFSGEATIMRTAGGARAAQGWTSANQIIEGNYHRIS